MAVEFLSDDPKPLLKALVDAVDGGHAPTWTYCDDGDFAHDRPQWRDARCLRPEVSNEVLTFTVALPEGKELTNEVYTVYDGRFVEFALKARRCPVQQGVCIRRAGRHRRPTAFILWPTEKGLRRCFFQVGPKRRMLLVKLLPSWRRNMSC